MALLSWKVLARHGAGMKAVYSWVVVGDKTSLSQIVVDMDAKRLVLKTAKGSVFIMR